MSLFAAPLAADDRPFEQISPQELIERLDSNSREKRLEAERELIHRGSAVLDVLPNSVGKESPAVRESLLRIRTEIEQRAAIDSVRPSLVTLSGNMSLKQVAEELEKQTGNRLDLSALPAENLEEKHEIELERATYWRSVEEISRLYSVRLTTAAGGQLGLAARPDNNEFPLAFDLSSSIRVAWLGNDLRTQEQIGRLIRIRLQFVLEPRLRGLYGTFQPRDLSLITDSGEKLSPHDPGATFEIPCGEGGKVLEIGIDFDLPAQSTFRTLQLSGAGDLEIAAGEERFEFRRLNDHEPQALRKGNVAVTFEPEAPEATDAKLKRFGILVRYDTAGPPFESHRLWIFHNRTFITSTEGKEISPADHETVLQQGRIVGLNYEFPLTNQELEGGTFVYIAPTRILSHRISFRFPAVRNGEQK